MMQSHFRVNVARNGRHLFATAEESAVDEREARNLMTLFRSKFPEAEGYSVTCTYWQVVGRRHDQLGIAEPPNLSKED